MGQQKNPATSTDKKSSNHLGQKKSRNLSKKKDYATSQDKKKSLNLSGQKNHATSWVNKNHETSWDQKIMLSIGPIAFELVHNALNCSKWHQLCPNRSK